MSQVRTIVCFRRRSSTILFGFAFDFLQFATVKSLKIFTICEICPPDHLKAEKIGVTEEVSSLFVIFCLLPLSQIWPYEFFLSTGTRKGTDLFNGPANFRKFHWRKRDKSCSKDPYFQVRRKTLSYGIGFHQDLYLTAWVNYRIHRLLAIFPTVLSFWTHEYYRCSCWKP